MAKKYTIYSVDTTNGGIKVKMARKGWKDVKVFLVNAEDDSEYGVGHFDNSKDANKYEKYLINNY